MGEGVNDRKKGSGMNTSDLIESNLSFVKQPETHCQIDKIHFHCHRHARRSTGKLRDSLLLCQYKRP